MPNSSQVIEAFAYSRLSDSQQAKVGRSGLNRQHRKFQKYIVQKELEGLKIKLKLKPMQDIGRSAYHGKHLDDSAELGSFLGRVKNGDIKVGSWLLIEDIDRLTRQYFLAAFSIVLYVVFLLLGDLGGIVLIVTSPNPNRCVAPVWYCLSLRNASASLADGKSNLKS
ncbi:TPA: hypothetical protein ACX6RC_003821 [Photobacterium damselae]